MIEPGDPAPSFQLPDQDGRPVRLADYSGERLIIYFYPKAFTPGCTTQACDFRDNHQAFAKAGYQIVGISPDPVDRLGRFRDEHQLPFPVLSDPNHATARDYGAWGKKVNYGREYEGIIRSTFVIGPDGSIEKAWRNVKAKGHGERILREVTA
ncbi:MAG: thioredoxin-dependent thiol peroxidase [Acidimicrobiia bacterium]